MHTCEVVVIHTLSFILYANMFRSFCGHFHVALQQEYTEYKRNYIRYMKMPIIHLVFPH